MANRKSSYRTYPHSIHQTSCCVCLPFTNEVCPLEGNFKLTSLVMLPWRRVSMCNRDNSWGIKALRRGRVTSGRQIQTGGINHRAKSIEIGLEQNQKHQSCGCCCHRIAFLSPTRAEMYVHTNTLTQTWRHADTNNTLPLCVGWSIWIHTVSDPDSFR